MWLNRKIIALKIVANVAEASCPTEPADRMFEGYINLRISTYTYFTGGIVNIEATR